MFTCVDLFIELKLITPSIFLPIQVTAKKPYDTTIHFSSPKYPITETGITTTMSKAYKKKKNNPDQYEQFHSMISL